ncbi:MAG: hypothetical protein QXT05_02925 [Candidatus Bilamarchaeaceae archaeon]
MIKLLLRMHPDVLFAYTQNYVNMIIRTENHSTEPFWCEVDVRVPDGISLSSHNELKKGRIRMGILSKKEFVEKSVKIYGSTYTMPQVYQIEATLYAFNKDGVIDGRLEKKIELRCEVKKEEVM